MATLPRPGVEISQEIVTESPTVLTPSLVPCIVGPCFQIVSPITSAGLLNSGAQVTTAALIISSTVSDPALLSGKVMRVSVSGGDAQTIQFPVTINNVGISHALITTTINKQLTGAVAEFKNNKLTLKTESKGATSSLKLLTVDPPATDAYSDLGLSSFEDKLITGSSAYANLSYKVPYTSLPSPLADVSEIVLQGSGIDIFRYFNNTLTQFSETSAINWNSYTPIDSSSGATDTLGTDSNAITSAHQPAYNLGRTKLFGKPSVGTKTNTLANLGRSASLTIPLAHDNSPFAAGSKWPDVTGARYLKVSAVGTEPVVDNPAASPGAYVGSSGNAVQVSITSGLTESATWTDGNDTLSIVVVPGTTTLDQLRTAINGVTGITGKIKIELAFPESDKGDVALFATDDPVDSIYRLAGGIDPTNFAPTNVAAEQAHVMGAVHVTSGATGDDLGVTGKVLEVSIDGGDFISTTFTSNDPVVTAINTALGTVANCTSVPAQKNSLAESFAALRIQTTSINKHDSTIELRASDKTVIENLFGGYKTRTETVTSPTLSSNNRVLDPLVSGTDYNELAETSNEKAISRGSFTASVSNCLSIGSLLFDGGDDLSAFANAPVTLELAHSTNGGDTDTTPAFTVTTLAPLSGAPDITELATALDAAIHGTPEDDLVGFSVAILGVAGSKLMVYDKTGLAGGAVRVSTAFTTAGLAGALDPGGTIFTNDTTGYSATESVTLTFKDSGADGALQLSSSNNFSNTKVGGSLTVDPDIDLVISGSHGLNHSNGEFTLAFAGDSFNAPPNELPIALALTNTSEVTLTYSRVHACCTGPLSPSYTTRLFHGDSGQTLLGDLLYNNGSVLGRVVAVEDYVLGTNTYTNAQLVLSEYAVDAGATVSDWYITAEGLVSGDDRVGAEATYSDLEGTINVKHALIRNGAGIANAGSSAPVYVEYKALRKDVTSSAKDPGLLVFNNAAEVESLIGPISQENPLAFGLSLAFLNAPSISLSAIGVDETTADAPDGTVDAYDRALDFLELKEVYSIAPLTQDREVHKLLNLHVQALSQPVAKKERMAIVCPALPTEKEPTLVISGTATLGPAINNKYILTFEDETLNIPVALNGKTDANGNTINGAVLATYDTVPGIYVDRAGDAFKYIVSGTPATNQVEITVEPGIYLPGGGPGTGGNDDGYYKTDGSALADFPATGELVTIFVRQAAISTSTTAGKLSACEALAEIAGGATGYQNRRLVMLQPEQVGTTLDGTEILVPGHYLGAAVAAMIGQQNPSQPFTNLPMVGFTRPVGSSDKFSETQMATAAAGGVYWVIQDVAGGSLASRHQLTTDVTSLKTRELSILKSVDYLAKLIRNQVKRFVGRNNITKALLETVSLGIGGALANATGSVVASATLTRIAQDPTNLDTIQVEISVTPFYPANSIKITIFV